MKSLNGVAVVAALFCGNLGAVSLTADVVTFSLLDYPWTNDNDIIIVEGVSGDGSTVVGYLDVFWGNYWGIQWDASAVADQLPGYEAHNGVPYASLAVNHEGTAFAGWAYDWDLDAWPVATRWAHGHPPLLLGLLPGYSTSLSTDLSADASILVGYCSNYNGPQRAFRWTEATGMQDLGVMPGATSSRANGISGDGSVIVGTSGGRAFRWTQDGDFEDLGLLPGTETAEGLAISTDGQVVVGAAGTRAFRWTAASGMEDLGSLPNASSSAALAVNGDGSVIVGSSGNRAFLWRAGLGMVDLREHLLNEYGVTTNGFMLGPATAVSDDGGVIAGSAWMIRGLPPTASPPCPSDLDSDGLVGGSDLAMLLASWGASGKSNPSDLNGDGQVDGGDLAQLLGSWGECP